MLACRAPLYLALNIAFAALSDGTVIDRIAIVIQSHPIKDSDIERDIRITDFLNGDKLNVSDAVRKKSAQRLIEQQIIRREVELANYPRSTPAEVDQFLKTILKQRFEDNSASYQTVLENYGVSEQQLRAHLAWQITVLHFIEQRFRPAILVSDEETDRYFNEHVSQFPGKKVADVREQIRDRLIEERVNTDFEAWLDRAHKRTEVEYHEAGLQ